MTGKTRVLVVEDDPLIAMDLEDELVDRGYDVRCAATIAAAGRLIDEALPDVAILDMHLRSEPTFPLADDLGARGVPYFFLSGNDATALPPHLKTARILTKPARIEEVVRLAEAMARG